MVNRISDENVVEEKSQEEIQLELFKAMSIAEILYEVKEKDYLLEKEKTKKKIEDILEEYIINKYGRDLNIGKKDFYVEITKIDNRFVYRICLDKKAKAKKLELFKKLQEENTDINIDDYIVIL